MKPQRRPGVRGPESLESRTTPASLLAYTDIDGDKVTISASAGVLTGHATIVSGQLRLLDISDPSFNHASIAVSVVRAGAGDGLAAVGRINGGLNDLGTVTVQGDLGGITCGDSNAATGPGLKRLSVRSIGAYGTATQGTGGDLFSAIGGSLGSLQVGGDLRDASFGARNFGDRPDGRIGSVTIGGSLVGSGDFEGFLFSTGDMGPVTIRRDLVGGPGDDSGEINSGGSLGPVTIGGTVIGGGGDNSGRVFSTGDMGTVKIGGDIVGAAGNASGAIDSRGTLAGVTVGGSVLGGSNPATGSVDLASGAITASGGLGPVKIRGDLRGGTGEYSGHVHSDVRIGTVTIGGSVIGGAGAGSGLINSVGKLAGVTVGGSLVGGPGRFSGVIQNGGDMGVVQVGHDVRGGAGDFSAHIVANGKLAGVAVGGSLVGGPAAFSGEIFSGGDMGAVKVGGNITSASIVAGALDGSGLIESGGRIAGVTVGGSIVAGVDNSSGGGLLKSASIRAAADIGAVAVKGSLVGSVGSGGDVTDVIISAGGQAFPTAIKDVAIGQISVGGRVERTRILAGYNGNLTPVDGNAQIGTVTVGGDWVASDLVAGVKDGGAAGFGDAGDTVIGGGPSIARIASVTIKGVVVGTPAAGDQFGFESHAIGSLKINGVSIPIASPVSLSPITGDDVSVRLV